MAVCQSILRNYAQLRPIRSLSSIHCHHFHCRSLSSSNRNSLSSLKSLSNANHISRRLLSPHSSSLTSKTCKSQIKIHQFRYISTHHHDEMSQLSLFEKSRLIQQAGRLTVSILGPSNAGKSTLFNRLMCKESNKSYRLSSEKSVRRPNRSKVCD